MAASSSASQRVRPRRDAQQRRIEFPECVERLQQGVGGAGGVLNEGSAQKWNRAKMATLRKKKVVEGTLALSGAWSGSRENVTRQRGR